ncbi:MAG: hypothetical protein ACI9XC_001259 [Gammaproteobacteria bacterium]|jgi:hypothetical protein
MTGSQSITGVTTSPETTSSDNLILGWREWIALPELGIPAIKAKVDTGARTSALHTFKIEPFNNNGLDFVRFWLHPLRNKRDIELVCEAAVIDSRIVKDSGGHTEERYVITSPVCIGSHKWNIEITLTNRENMMFKMLLGRTAIIHSKITIDPSASYLTGRGLRKIYDNIK